MSKRVSGVILAAGKSERMGQPKPLLPILGSTFLEHIVSESRASRLYDLKIVLGHGAEEILRRLPGLRSAAVINPHYPQGQLSSIQEGIRSLQSGNADGLMLFLVDHPFVGRELIDELIRCFSEKGNPIVIPTFQGKRGHPVIFAKELFPDLLAAPPERGAVAVVKQHHHRIYHLEWQSDDMLIDVDTPEAYQRFVQQRTMES